MNNIDIYFINYLIKKIINIISDIIIEIIFISKNIIWSLKSICNIYIIFNITIFISNIILKINFYDFYKKLKLYRYILLNVIFFITITYLLDLGVNSALWMNNIYIKLGNEKLTFLSLFLSLIWILITLFISLYNTILFEILFKDLEEIDLNFKVLFYKFLSSFLFFLVLITGFTFMNLDTFILGIIGGAFSLGFSISIQKVISNYISGLMILSDRSFKLGDAVNINGFQGVITQISNRYVMLRNLDCSEILVPNEKFLNDIVQNQSLYFSKGNLRIAIQISYNNDVNLVLNLLIDSTRGINRILDNPFAISYFTNFNINGIDLELSFWIVDAVRGAALVRSEVNINIWNILKKNNIELSYSKKVLKILN